MANTFLSAQGYGIGISLTEKKMLQTAEKIIQELKYKKCKLVLPLDIVCANSLNEKKKPKLLELIVAQLDKMILDIGIQSQKNIKDIINKSKTLIWNGPLGAFETRPFDQGTNNIANYAANRTSKKQLISIAGGGDTVSALKTSASISKFSYVSTAGGAFLEWLEGKSLPGINHSNYKKMILLRIKYAMIRLRSLNCSKVLKF